MNWRDLLFLNIVSFGGAWSIIFALTYAPYYSGDPAVSLLLTAPGILALLGIYYIFTSSMPRSGGDYVFMSRILHPAIGLAANFVGYTMFLWFWIGDAASVFTNQGVAQTLSVYGSLSGAAWATNGATWFTQPVNNFLVGTLFIAMFALVVSLRRRLYFWIQNTFMTIAVIGLVIIAALVIQAALNPSIFVNNFNHYAASIGASLKPDAYSNITQSGIASGALPDTNPLNLGNNFLLVPLWFTVLFWVYVSNYLGGETKNVRSTAKRALFGSFAIIFLATIVILEAAYKGLGVPFLYGANNIYYYGSSPFGGVLPQLAMFAGILANNPIVVLFLGLGIVAGFIMVAPQCMILMSRIMFSYSFDRVAPKGLADVNERFNTPVKAILVAVVGGEIMLSFLSGIWGGTTQSTALTLFIYAGLSTIALTFTFVSITAIIWPYRRKQLYEVSSVVKKKVLGVPVITLLGIISLIYTLGTALEYMFLNQTFYTFGCPAGGAVGCDFNYFLVFLGVLFVAAILYYFGISRYRSRGGMPFNLTFKEIPPE